MIQALALMVAALLIGCTGHWPLRWLSERCRDPVTAMACWVVSIVGVLMTFAVSAVLLVVPGDHPNGLAEHFAHGCWVLLTHGRVPAVDETAGAIGLAAVAVSSALFVRALRQGLRAHQSSHGEHLSLLRILGGNEGRAPVLWLEHGQPFAYSVSGRPGVVVATTGLLALPASQLSAVFSHERAHLRRHHHLLLTVTRALARAVPFLPLVRRAPQALSLLVELDADTAAVRSCGQRAVRAALLALTCTEATKPSTALAIVGEDLPQRLQRIDDDTGTATARRLCMRAAAVIGPAVLPTITGLSALLVALALSCPTS